MSETAQKIEKRADWPRTADGEICWQQVFDGLIIPLLDDIKTTDAFIQFIELIIDELFCYQDEERREKDAKIRNGVRSTVGKICEKNQNFNQKRADIKKILENLRDHNIRAAERAANGKVKKAVPPLPPAPPQPQLGEQGEEVNLASIVEGVIAEEKKQPPPPKPVDPETLTPEEQMKYYFEKEIIKIWETQFRKINKSAGPDTPFFMSQDFKAHFLEIIKAQVIPQLQKNCETILNNQLNKQNGEMNTADLMQSFMASIDNQKAIGHSWDAAWKEVAEKKPLPREPEKEEVEGVKGLMGKGRRAKKHEEEMTAWGGACARIEEENKKVDDFIKSICKENDKYQSPREQDMHLLGELFKMDIDGIKKEVSALQQLIKQTMNNNEDRLGEVLAKYRKLNQLDFEIVLAYFQAYKGKQGDEKLKAAITHVYRRQIKKNPNALHKAKPLLSHFILQLNQP